ncbi:MAG: AAA family ATPase [Candidatus Eisenbacteria bacterium]|nr:AAA family ATPase [Candidatus Eisenbacteria bacterium]
MRRLVVASTRENAGKTSLIVGLGVASDASFGYLKPFGDRLLYKKKRLWDYDSALVASVFDLEQDPKDMSIGFDHSKVRFMYDREGTRERLSELTKSAEEGKDAVLIEAGRDLTYGISVDLDAVSLADSTGAALLIVVAGEDRTIVDDMAFVRTHVNLGDVELAGFVLNGLSDVEDFNNTYESEIEKLGVPVLGYVPRESELLSPSMGFLSELLFAKVVTGEGGLDSTAKNIFVGAMSGDAAARQPAFTKPRKLVITSGDRSDMILAALSGDTAGIVLTNGIAPPSSIISKAAEKGVPMLLSPDDTFRVAKQIDDASYLLRADEKDKIEKLGKLVKENVDIAAVLGG